MTEIDDVLDEALERSVNEVVERMVEAPTDDHALELDHALFAVAVDLHLIRIAVQEINHRARKAAAS